MLLVNQGSRIPLNCTGKALHGFVHTSVRKMCKVLKECNLKVAGM